MLIRRFWCWLSSGHFVHRDALIDRRAGAPRWITRLSCECGLARGVVAGTPSQAEAQVLGQWWKP